MVMSLPPSKNNEWREMNLIIDPDFFGILVGAILWTAFLYLLIFGFVAAIVRLDEYLYKLEEKKKRGRRRW